MVSKCCIVGCKSIADKNCTATFLRFPKNDEEILQLWKNVIKQHQPQFSISPCSVICHLHFVDNDFILNVAGTKRVLKTTSVPSIFPTYESRKILFDDEQILPSTSMDAETVTLSMSDVLHDPIDPDHKNDQDSISSISTCMDDTANTINDNQVVDSVDIQLSTENIIRTSVVTSRKRKSYFGDFHSLDDINSLRKHWNMTYEKHRQYVSEIKKLRTKNNRLYLKIKNLSQLIDDLKAEKNISDDCSTTLKISKK